MKTNGVEGFNLQENIDRNSKINYENGREDLWNEIMDLLGEHHSNGESHNYIGFVDSLLEKHRKERNIF